MSKLLIDNVYYINADEEGRVWLCDKISGRWIPIEHAKWLRNILDRYINEFDEIEVCRNFEDELERKRHNYTQHSKKTPAPTRGYVYILESDYGYKIGKTTQLSKRMSHFIVKLPIKITLLGTIECSDYSAVEKELHETFAHKQINGEWYNLNEDDLMYIIANYDAFEEVNEELK